LRKLASGPEGRTEPHHFRPPTSPQASARGAFRRSDINLRADFLNVRHHAFSEIMTVRELWIPIMSACERAIKWFRTITIQSSGVSAAPRNILIVGDMGSESHWPIQEFPQSPVSQYKCVVSWTSSLVWCPRMRKTPTQRHMAITSGD
jgi:hypothetical protein